MSPRAGGGDGFGADDALWARWPEDGDRPVRRRLDDGQIEVVDEAVAGILRRKTPAERVAMVLACNRTGRLVLEAQIRRRHPDWTDPQVAAEVAGRMLRGAD